MRVLIDYRAALRERSGVGEYTHQLVRALPAAADPGTLDLTIFSSSWRDRVAAEVRELHHVSVIDRRVPVRVLNFAWHRLEWPAAETLTGSAFDVTHSMHPLMLPSRRAARVVTIHDLNFLDFPERTRAEIRRDYPVLARDHAHRADRVIVPSQFTAREVERRLEIPLEKISVCPLGAPDWRAPKRLRRRGYVLFFGTLEPRKNVGSLLDAYERLAATRRPETPQQEANGRAGANGLPELVLAGKETEQSGPWLARIAQPPLNAIVRHIGYVDPNRRRELYDGARLLVQPSFEEGFGLPVLEAMAAGVPVVAANRGALPEVLGDAGELVDPGDSEAMASAIARLLDDDAHAASCVEKGAVRARQFTWSATAGRVYDAYRRAVEHRQCASV